MVADVVMGQGAALGGGQRSQDMEHWNLSRRRATSWASMMLCVGLGGFGGGGYGTEELTVMVDGIHVGLSTEECVEMPMG